MAKAAARLSLWLPSIINVSAQQLLQITRTAMAGSFPGGYEDGEKEQQIVDP
jgi:hypothetical protein